MFTHVGIDEAGYGPLLGPLVLCTLRYDLEDDAETAPRDLFTAAGLRVDDSKKIHTPKDLRPLEAVALELIQALTGWLPTTAGELLALLGEDEAERAPAPWMAGLGDLKLPVSAAEPRRLDLLAPRMATIDGAVIHPWHLNTAARNGRNKADLLLAGVCSCLKPVLTGPHPSRTVVDRLGGRRYYAQTLHGISDAITGCEVAAESRERSAYLIEAGGIAHQVAFVVGGDALSPLTAAASCLAKYVREIHMHHFNAWWSRKYPWLKPTKGYPQDAKRWLFQIGAGTRNAYGDQLVRGQVELPG